MEKIFTIWDNLKDMASDLGRPYPTVAAWHQRQRIPAHHDAAIVAASKRLGKPISFEEIAQIRAAQGHGNMKQEAAQ